MKKHDIQDLAGVMGKGTQTQLQYSSDVTFSSGQSLCAPVLQAKQQMSIYVPKGDSLGGG
jgi:hypothetical protein